MFKREKQIKYLRKRLRSLLKNFDLFVATHHPEALHGLRVDIKKVKALVLFADDCIQSNVIKNFKGIKKVFKAAGKIRTSWIHMELMIANNVKDITLYKHNEKEFHDSSFEFLMVSDYYRDKLQRSIKKIIQHMKDIDETCILNEYNNRLVKLNQIYKGKDLKENLHESRKIIKNLLYTYDVLPAYIATKTQLNISYLKELEDSIGKWHDNDLAVEMFDKNKKMGTAVIKLKQNTQVTLNKVKKQAMDFDKRSVFYS